MPNGVHLEKSRLSNCTLIVTMSVQRGYLTRSLLRSEYVTEWYCFSHASFLDVSVFVLARCPCVSMGRDALWIN